MAQLPAGTVTLFFTDIEGSTRLLADLGDAYSEALAEHRRVLREAFARHGGIEVDTQGDSFFAAFSRPSDAIEAADDAQRALADGVVQVRIGLHTGEPKLEREGYVGLDVHTAARICSVAHGGQVLLSQRTRSEIHGPLQTRDLGLHRLKDLAEPLRLYQLGEQEFPPLRSLNATNLPALPNPLVGREHELEEVTALLRDGARLVTLTGPGGTGKTRLALQAARELTDDFPDGVYWAPLGSLREAQLTLHTVEETIGAKAGLADHVDQKRMLLLLDNFEQLLPAAADLAAVLARCPNLKLLVTSRAVLRLSGEHELRVPPLPHDDAVTLFMQRARAVRPEVEADEAVAEICGRLDGLPLAIELAAARIRIFEPEELLARLDERLPLLTGGARDLPERQRTLRATIEWSYDLLDRDEQCALARVAVFAGSWCAAAAELVCETDVEELQSLVEHNLIRFREGRFSMLETIREFGLKRLEERREEDELRHRHARFFVERAEQLGPAITEAGGRDRLATLEQDSANIVTAMTWLVARSHAEPALRLAGSLRLFWILRGRATLARELLEQALELDGSVAAPVRARALSVLATLVAHSGDLQRSEELEELAQRLFERGGSDSYGVGRSLLSRAWLAAERSDLDVAEELARKGLDVANRIGNRPLEGLAHNHLGMVARRRGDLATAKEFFENAFADWRASGNEVGATGALSNLAAVSVLTGDLAGAEQLAEQALAVNRAIPYELHAAGDLYLLGLIAIKRQRRKEAASRLAESLATLRDLADLAQAVDSLELLAVTFPPRRAPEAVRMWAAVSAFRGRAGLPAPTEPARDIVENALEECRSELGEHGFQEAWSEGHSLPIEAAIHEALSLSEPTVRQQPSRPEAAARRSAPA
jgi:predicted ATPase